MKKSSLIILCVVLTLTSLARAQYRSDSCGCPRPFANNFGPWLPATTDVNQTLSPDGKLLSYTEGDAAIYILDPRTLVSTTVVVSGGLPGEIDLAYSPPIWCPHDPDLIAFVVTSVIDTTNSGHSDVQVTNLFTYRVSTGESKRITPDTCGKYGSHVGTAFFAWLPGSTQNFDSLLVGVPVPGAKGFYGVYVPQTQALIRRWTNPQTGQPDVPRIAAVSPDGRHRVIAIYDTISPTDSQTYYLDTTQFACPRRIQSVDYASFSPNSKLLALTVSPFGVNAVNDSELVDSIFEQVWIFSADSANPTSMQVINFQCLYCKFNYAGADAEFLTDSTLVVSMHPDSNGSISALYEITLGGRIVRKLTWLDSTAFEAAPPKELQLSLHPSIASDHVDIDFASSRSRSFVTMFDVLGREVLSRSIAPGERTLEIKTLRWQNGTYFCRYSSEADAKTVKFVVQR